MATLGFVYDRALKNVSTMFAIDELKPKQKVIHILYAWILVYCIDNWISYAISRNILHSYNSKYVETCVIMH